jgi:methionine-rich copper-binding protein CopC
MASLRSLSFAEHLSGAWRACAVVALALFGASAAHAHAFLDHANPAVGGAVHGPPAQMELWFSERIEPVFSSIRVVDEKGQEVDKGNTAIAGNDQTRLTVSVRPLPPGTYKVLWHVISSDTHATEGNFTFMVAP